MHRRDLLSFSAAALGFSGLPGQNAAPAHEFGARVFNVLAYGAQPDGRTKNTRMIQAAIDAAFHSGGGLVYLPPGFF